MDNPTQPRDPLKAAAAEYCKLRHVDGEACKGGGDCFFCQDTAARIIRAYNSEALTKGE